MSEQDATLDEFASTEHTPTERVETSLGVIPADWAVESLDDICSINPDGFSEDDWPEPTFEYIDLSNVSEGEIVQSETTPVDDAPSRAQRQVKQGDVLVGTVRPKQVSHGFVTEEHDGKICSSGFGVLRTPANLHPLYLLQEVLSHRFFRQMEAYVAGSGYPAVKVGDLRKHRITVPPLEEQRKIASVLYTVDQAIQKTEEIIEQTRCARAGLEQDIFSTGYYEHEATQEVRLGPIKTSTPEDWDMKTIPDRFDIIDGDRGKNYPKQSEFYDDGYCLFLSADNVTEEGLEFHDTEFISKEKDEELRKGKLSRGDIVMTTRGTVGNFGFYDEEVDYDNMRINSGMVILRPKSGVTNPVYYYHLFRSRIFQKQINATSYGTAQPQTSVTDLEKMKLIEPEDDEKGKIGELIEDLNTVIYSNEEYKNKLQHLKKGLMQDLLSGEVRTHDKDIEIVDEVLQHG